MQNKLDINALNFKNITKLCEEIIKEITQKIYCESYAIDIIELIKLPILNAIELNQNEKSNDASIHLDRVLSDLELSIDKIIDLIKLDIKIVIEKDPAFESYLEVLLCYPGIKAIILYRISHQL